MLDIIQSFEKSRKKEILKELKIDALLALSRKRDY
jgi:hypothetical protein